MVGYDAFSTEETLSGTFLQAVILTKTAKAIDNDIFILFILNLVFS